MKHFIKDVRKDLGVAKLSFVIAATGQSGSKLATGPILTIQQAQLAINDVPACRGKATAFCTDVLID